MCPVPLTVRGKSTRGAAGRRRRAELVCPCSVLRHSPLEASHIMSVRSLDPDTMLPFDRTATHVTSCAPRGVDEQSTVRFDWTPAPRIARVPGQSMEALF